MQIKLNELIACNDRASNRIVGIEDLTEEEMNILKTFYTKLAALAKSEGDLMSSHSIDEAVDNHQEKTNKWVIWNKFPLEIILAKVKK